jgi:hypothetical protein
MKSPMSYDKKLMDQVTEELKTSIRESQDRLLREGTIILKRSEERFLKRTSTQNLAALDSQLKK